jgi:hypothetical protein
MDIVIIAAPLVIVWIAFIVILSKASRKDENYYHLDGK